MKFAHGITAVVLRSGGEDAQGDALPGTSHEVTGCAVLPARSTENDDRGQQVRVDLTLSMPAGADVTATDRVLIAEPDPWAGTYDVLGRPVPLRSPFSGWSPGTLVALGRVDG